jgi:hypothetical protein
MCFQFPNTRSPTWFYDICENYLKGMQHAILGKYYRLWYDAFHWLSKQCPSTISEILCSKNYDFFFFWSLCSLLFFDIRNLITPLVSSNSSNFWPLCCLFFFITFKSLNVLIILISGNKHNWYCIKKKKNTKKTKNIENGLLILFFNTYNDLNVIL